MTMTILFLSISSFTICSSFFFSSRRRHTRSLCDWSSDVCSSDLMKVAAHSHGKQAIDHTIALGVDSIEHSTDRKSTRLNSSHTVISYAVFCLKKKNATKPRLPLLPDHSIARTTHPPHSPPQPITR